MLFLQLFQPFGQGLERRLAGSLPQPVGQLDLYLLGLLPRIALAEYLLEQLRVDNEKSGARVADLEAALAAAKKARKQLDLATLLKLYRAVPLAPCRVVESAGGVAVPIDPKGKDWSDFAAAIKPMAVIIVVEDRLGAINQARLAIAYLRRRYDGPMGVWLNAIKKPTPAVAAANRAGLADAWIPLYGESGPGKKPPRFHFLPR
jgi:dethiobiotin synthetase